MEMFKEIIELLKVLVWPSIVLVFGFVFKSTINEFLGRIKGAKYKNVEIAFQENLAEANELMIKSNVDNANLIYSSDKNLKMSTEFLNKLKELSEVSPRSLITESWIQLETTINIILKDHVKGTTKLHANLNDLIENKILDSKDIDIYKNIRNMRNNIVHNYDYKVNQDEAIEYALLVYRLMEKINNKLKTKLS